MDGFAPLPFEVVEAAGAPPSRRIDGDDTTFMDSTDTGRDRDRGVPVLLAGLPGVAGEPRPDVGVSRVRADSTLSFMRDFTGFKLQCTGEVGVPLPTPLPAAVAAAAAAAAAGVVGAGDAVAVAAGAGVAAACVSLMLATRGVEGVRTRPRA